MQDIDPDHYGDYNLNDAEQRAEMIKKVAKSPPDPLFARIESEPIDDNNASSAVRQIIINVNTSNGHYNPQAGDVYARGEDKDEYIGQYKYRPIVFYYTGPEKDMKNDKPVSGMLSYSVGDGRETVRDSFPVIINMNEDFRGIFFFPNSPVVLNGNGNNFQGYIVAKEFVMLTNYKDDYLHDERNDVYYAKSRLVKNFYGEKVKDSAEYQAVTYNGQEKYILKSDLENYTAATGDEDFKNNGDTWYNSNEIGTADEMATASGNGRVNYYYTLSKNTNNNWTPDQIIEETNKIEWILQGTGYFNRKDSSVFQIFANGWRYNNYGNVGDQGVWRAREILPDGTLGEWLDAMEGDTKNKFLLKVKDVYKPKNFYDTAEELLNKLGGYTQLNSNTWIKADATSYMKITANGETYYIPVDDNITLRDGNEPVVPNTILVKYWENCREIEGYADISDDPESYHLTYPKDSYGNDTELNPMFVDEWGNVQYKKNADGSYKTIPSEHLSAENLQMKDPSLTLFLH